MITLRARGPSLQVTVDGLDPATTTVQSFLDLLQQKLSLPHQQLTILAGFPPKPVQLPDDRAAPLASLQLCNGESITIQLDAAPPVPIRKPAAADVDDEDADLARAIAASLADVPAPNVETHMPPTAAATSYGTSLDVPLANGTVMTRRVIDSDNSCLFNAVGYVMEHSRTQSTRLRRVIADTVAGDPLTYTDGFLGKEPEAYCTWIQQKSSWGGGIELSILARYYGREIAAFDIHTQRADVYGEDAGYAERVLLLYDGLHYDALALAQFPGAPEDMDVSILPCNTPELADAMEAARALVARAKAARQYTDTASFTLRCGVCFVGVKGEAEAVEHAKATGHQNFTEYN